MNHILTITILAALFLAPLARADEAEDKLEKRIEGKVLANHQAAKAANGGSKSAKAKLETRADSHANFVRGASGHANGKPEKTPMKKPPEKKKPIPPPHHR